MEEEVCPCHTCGENMSVWYRREKPEERGGACIIACSSRSFVGEYCLLSYITDYCGFLPESAAIAQWNGLRYGTKG